MCLPLAERQSVQVRIATGAIGPADGPTWKRIAVSFGTKTAQLSFNVPLEAWYDGLEQAQPVSVTQRAVAISAPKKLLSCVKAASPALFKAQPRVTDESGADDSSYADDSSSDRDSSVDVSSRGGGSSRNTSSVDDTADDKQAANTAALINVLESAGVLRSTEHRWRAPTPGQAASAVPMLTVKQRADPVRFEHALAPAHVCCTNVLPFRPQSWMLWGTRQVLKRATHTAACNNPVAMQEIFYEPVAARFDINLNVSIGGGPFLGSRVITFAPTYVLVNSADVPVEVCQLRSHVVVTMQPGESRPWPWFHNEKEPQLLARPVSDMDWHWSGAFSIAEVGNYNLRLSSGQRREGADENVFRGYTIFPIGVTMQACTSFLLVISCAI